MTASAETAQEKWHRTMSEAGSRRATSLCGTHDFGVPGHHAEATTRERGTPRGSALSQPSATVSCDDSGPPTVWQKLLETRK